MNCLKWITGPCCPERELQGVPTPLDQLSMHIEESGQEVVHVTRTLCTAQSRLLPGIYSCLRAVGSSRQAFSAKPGAFDAEPLVRLFHLSSASLAAQVEITANQASAPMTRLSSHSPV